MSCILAADVRHPLFMALGNRRRRPHADRAGQPASSNPPPRCSGCKNLLPLVGDKLFEFWQQILASGGQVLFTKQPSISGRKPAGSRYSLAGNLGLLFVHFLLTVAICGLLITRGKGAADGIRRFAHCLAGQRGDNAVVLASRAIRASP